MVLIRAFLLLGLAGVYAVALPRAKQRWLLSELGRVYFQIPSHLLGDVKNVTAFEIVPSSCKVGGADWAKKTSSNRRNPSP